MKIIVNIILCLSFSIQLICCLSFPSFAQKIQRYNSFSYNVNDGLLQSTIHDIAFDSNNFCWISFPNGIQRFDGKIFTVVPVQPGLPDDKFCIFFRCNNGDLLISHSKGISKYDISNNRFRQVYINAVSVENPVIFIGQDADIIYFYNKTGTITGINCNTYKVAAETKTGFPDYWIYTDSRPKFSDNIINHRVAIEMKSTLYLWDLQKGKMFSQSLLIADISMYLLVLKNEDEVLYAGDKTNNVLHSYNYTTHADSSWVIQGKDDNKIYRSFLYFWQKNKILISFNNRLFEADSLLQFLKAEIVNFQNQPVSGIFAINRMKEDNFGNLYLQTVRNGLTKIIRNNYPIKYYGTDKREDNFVMCIFPDKKNNRILAGTSGNGLLVFDTLQHLIKHIDILPEQKKSTAINVIIKNSHGDYVLFISGEKKVWILKNDLSRIESILISTPLLPGKSGINYFGNLIYQDENKTIVQSQGRLYKMSSQTNTITEKEFSNAYIMSGLLFNNMIISHGNDELLFLDTMDYKVLKKIPFKNTGNVRCFTKDAANNIFIGSNKGIYKIDSNGKILMHLNRESGLPDECIYSMVFDSEGFLWCSTNKGIFKVNNDNSILQLKKEDGLQENEFNTNAVAKGDDGEIFFGGVNGVSSFYPPAINAIEEKPNIFFTNIKINNVAISDSAAWNVKHIDLAYDQNSLSFDFIAMASNNPGQYIYQYRMDGADEQWIQNIDMQTVRYHLPHGEYIFKIYASRFFDKDAKAMKQIIINIHPPFWKTWWFSILIGILAAASLGYIIYQYVHGKYEKKLAALESEQQLRLERERISRDLHDNIGAYANAVLHHTELLQLEINPVKRTDLMQNLNFASRDIITSLRETIWALKKGNYTAEESFLRIRNFIQPLMRYYPQIKFSIEDIELEYKILHYTIALNLVRIVQEAITNAIKHAGASTIRIISNQKPDQWEVIVSDDGRGFNDKADNETSQGNGLSNMKQRAADSGFDLKIRSWPGAGTSVIIQMNNQKLKS